MLRSGTRAFSLNIFYSLNVKSEGISYKFEMSNEYFLKYKIIVVKIAMTHIRIYMEKKLASKKAN